MLTHLMKTFVMISTLSISCSCSAITTDQCDKIARQLSESFSAVFRHVDDLVNGLITPQMYADRTDQYKIYPINITFGPSVGFYPNGTEVAKFLTAQFTYEFTLFHHRGLGKICTNDEVSAMATARNDVKIRGMGDQYFSFGGYIDLFGRRCSDGVFRVYKYVEVITPTPFISLGVAPPTTAPPTTAPRDCCCRNGKTCGKDSSDSSEKTTADGFVAQSNNQQLDLTPFYVVLSMMVGVILVLICGLCYLTNQFLRVKSTMLPPKLGDAGSGPDMLVIPAPRVQRVRSGSGSELI